MTHKNYLKLLEDVMNKGCEVSPRGMQVKEIENKSFEFNPLFPFVNFKERKYNIDYFKKEMVWKLGADKYDTSIQDHAKIWKNSINSDMTLNSNYGQYWFGEQMGVFHAANELIRDNDTRRSIIPMLNKSHMGAGTNDTVCTEAIGFRIRTYNGFNVLNMSVHMRSSDIIFGLGTDIPTFSFLYRLVFALIENSIEHPISFGKINITSMSSHIYERHYEMAEKILNGGIEESVLDQMPFCKFNEAMYLIAKRGRMKHTLKDFSLCEWLKDRNNFL